METSGDMEKFKLKKKTEPINSVNRTIRFKGEHFEKIAALSEKTGLSFNKIVLQCIEYALNNLEEPEEDGA